MTENELSKIFVDCAFRIHNELDPGLLGSVYEEVFADELTKREVLIERQEALPVI